MKLSKYIKRYWYIYAIAIVCMTISIALDMLSPRILKLIIDDVIVAGKVELLTRLLITIFMIGVGRALFGYFKEVLFDSVSSKIGADIRRNLFRHVQSLSLDYFDKNNTGELMSRLKDDVDKVWSGVGFIGMLVVEVIIHTSLVLYSMYTLSPKLTVIPLVAMPIVAFIAIRMEKKLDNVYEEISEENAKLNLVAQENLAGVRTVKAFAREKFEIGKFLSHNKRYYELNMRQSKVLIKYNPFFQFITRLLPVIVIVAGGFLVIQEDITLGTLGAFAEYANNIVWPMELLGWLFNDMASAAASTKRINKIMIEKPTVISKEDSIPLEKAAGDVEFENVSFNVNDTTVLKNVSFHLEPGKTLGIMGATGSGKTSVINLLQRFYETTEGNIKLDGINVKDLSLYDLRKNMALVMQDVFLFSDTVNENVKMGLRPQLTDQEVIHATIQAQASDFIEKMDDQYDTVIGERGVGLSGGQKQRISIARALAKKTPILIMDDSTSALDMETEHLIQKNLNDLEHTTKIVIAHRISAVRNADEIIFLEDGAIAERGTHESLLEKKGLYYQTYMAQYGDYLTDNSLKEVKKDASLVI
ncbi:ABC transporter ATP-binding protein [Clostridium sp. KNHs205]|jgi:ATP-binding cassette, subfamily B, multidrug efflux pump|uniref:ABC transporter ATP-binding protein n=1 Tax=Clostridium sp. KNHs205 TaxID=1449050 RepID=UPI00051C2EBF|nr:ABC transporter ATP-binding protein [Clostridium sp. KNHs205]